MREVQENGENSEKIQVIGMSGSSTDFFPLLFESRRKFTRVFYVYITRARAHTDLVQRADAVLAHQCRDAAVKGERTRRIRGRGKAPKDANPGRDGGKPLDRGKKI